MALPDDDGTQQAEVAAFKRKRRLKLAGLAVLMVGILAGVGYFFTRQFPADTTEAEDLAQVRSCDMHKMNLHLDVRGQLRHRSYVTGACNKLVLRLLRRLYQDPSLCDRIARKIAGEQDWERKNRLLHVLMRYRRAVYTDEAMLTQRELERQPCIEEPLVSMVQQWAKDPASTTARNRNPGGLIPGVAKYNVRFLSHMRFLATNTYLLQRVRLPRPVARRLAAHLLGQYRGLIRGATIDMQKPIKALFDEQFYPLWEKLGKPEPKQ